MSWFKRKPRKDIRNYAAGLNYAAGNYTPNPGQHYRESQSTISDWGFKQFGREGSSIAIGARANEEMGELITALARAHSTQKVAEEMADVVIVLSQLAAHLGVDLRLEIDKKMNINRNRTWKQTENGYYHEKGNGAETPK